MFKVINTKEIRVAAHGEKVERIFRAIVSGALCMELAWQFIPWDRLYAVELSAALTWYGAGAQMGLGALIIAGNLVSLAYIASGLGMLFFLNWARHLFLLLAVLRLAITSLSGIGVFSPVEAALGYMLSIVEGVVIAMAYSSVAASRFPKAISPRGP